MALPDVFVHAVRPTETVKICFRPDLVREYRKLKNSPNTSFSNKSVARQDELLAEITAASVDFVLRALPRRRWDALMAEYPPAADDKDQQAAGVDADGFMEALVRESLVSPELDDAGWAELDDLLTTGHWRQLCATAQALNMTGGNLPFE